MLDGTFLSDEAEDISLVARNVCDMLWNARKVMAPEKSQDDRRNKKHDLNATPLSATRPPAKEKGKVAMTKKRKNYFFG